VKPSPAEPTSDLPPPRPRALVWAVAIVSIVAVLVAVLVGLGVVGKAAPAETRKGGRDKVTAVQVATPSRADLVLSAVYRGELDAEAAELAAQAIGRLLTVSVGIGDRVKRGQTLAKVDATQSQRQLAEAQAQVRAAQAARQRASAELTAGQLNLERGERLLAERLTTEQEIDTFRARVEMARAEVAAADAQRGQAEARAALLSVQVKETVLVAPFDGAVAERHLDPGALVQPGTKVLRLVQSGPLRVRFRVPERDLARVTPNMPVAVRVQATGETEHAGHVHRLAAEVSRMDRSVLAEGLLDAEHDVLRPGMYADVRLAFGRLDNVLVVPSVALVERALPDGARETGVYTVEDGTAHFRKVKVSGSSGDRSAVEGLSDDARVVVLGHEKLRDKSPVRVASEQKP
jgi:RND family efflux transporter MFP subunit